MQADLIALVKSDLGGGRGDGGHPPAPGRLGGEGEEHLLGLVLVVLQEKSSTVCQEQWMAKF